MTLSYCEDDGVARRAASVTSPSRRDYQLRSCSPIQVRESEASRPQSPWLSRLEEREAGGACRGRYSNCFSGPLPDAFPDSVARSSYYSGPLPSASPMPSYFSRPGFVTGSTAVSAFRAGVQGGEHHISPEASLVSERVPEVGSSRESSFRGEEEEEFSVAGGDDEDDGDICEVGEVLYTSYLSKENERTTPRIGRVVSPLALVPVAQKLPSGRTRKCVSGELPTSGFELARQRALGAREYRSGEIAGVNGVYVPSTEMRSDVEALVKGGREISNTRKQVRPESVAAAAAPSNGASSCSELAIVVPASDGNAQKERPSFDSDSAMVAIPFKWEEMPGNSSKKAYSRSSSTPRRARDTPSEQTVTRTSQLGSVKIRTDIKASQMSERWIETEIEENSALRLQKSSSVSLKKCMKATNGVSSVAIPFKWEVEPGKPKIDEKTTSPSSEAMVPVLQLPPRLAGTTNSSTKRSSWSVSAPSSRRNSSVAGIRARQPARSFSASAVSTSSVGRYFLPSQEGSYHSLSPSLSPDAKARGVVGKAFRSSPLDNTGKPSGCDSHHGPIASQFGSPQYQTADYLCEENSSSWKRVRSPTSTLCGPGGDLSSNPSSCCVSDKSSSRKSNVSFTHSQTSGTSAESFEQWSYGDHISPRSRHASIREVPDSEGGFSRGGSVRGYGEGDLAPGSDGAMTKLRRKLNLKRSSSKPPMSPIQSSSLAAPFVAGSAGSARSVDANGYSSHGEEFFDCQGSGSSPSLSPFSDAKKVETSHSDIEAEAEAELPTRLPYKMPSPAHDVKVNGESPPSSPPRGRAEFSSCLGLSRFLSRGETQCFWMENPSWDLPDAPRSVAEDGFKSPAYKATLDLLSPSPNLLSKKSVSKLSRTSSSRRRQPHLVELLCNSLKQSLQRCTKRSVARTQSIILNEDQFTKRHQSFMW